jgi:stage II sporulation protein D
MKKKNFLKILSIFLIGLIAGEIFCEEAEKEYEKIRVLLSKCEIEEKKRIKIRVRATGFIKVSDIAKDNVFSILKKSEILIEYLNGKWFIDGKMLKIKNIRIAPFDNESSKSNYLIWNNNSYEGFFDVIVKDGFAYLINELSFEDYISCVLGKETYGVWEIESHKVSAIVSRTFALNKMINARKKNRIFDINSTIEDQRYLGFCWNEKIQIAVDETRGMVITFKDAPIVAMYHVCCGGVSPIECSGFDFKRHPYLGRKNKCTFCVSHKHYSWKIKIKKDEFCKRLSFFFNKNIVDIIKIDRIKESRAGSLSTMNINVKIINSKNKFYSEKIVISNNDFKKIFSLNMSFNSPMFKVKFDDKSLDVFGFGRGHLIGMCQIGAKKMVNEGYKCEEIIKFYYPGTVIKKYL